MPEANSLAATGSSKTGVLLVNLGTPDAPTPRAVRTYLREFLSDRRVVDTPRIIWWFVLNCIILVFRPGRVAKLYESIWMEAGSPLLVFAKQQTAALQGLLDELAPNSLSVKLAMTYGNPSLKSIFAEFKAEGVQRILVVPLYPQYSATTTGAVFDGIAKALCDEPDLPELRFVRDYYDDPQYISALASSISEYWAAEQKPKRLLMSFHGIPQKYADAGDPYPDQCKATARLLASRLELKESEWLCSFQSRFGPAAWIKPYTDKILEEWGEGELERVDLVCPAFTADCLETLEEIKEENAETFKEAGGKEYNYIPALNARPDFITCLAQLVQKHTRDWC